MGCVQSTNVDRSQSKLNNQIDKLLKKEASVVQSEIKLLIVGAGESGKSTIAKQLRILHQNGYSKEDLLTFKEIIHENIVSFVLTLLATAEKEELTIPENLVQDVEKIKATLIRDSDTGEKNVSSLSQVANEIKNFWSSEWTKKLVDDAEMNNLNKSTIALMNDLDRVFETGYIPSVNDVLLSRVKTTGIIENVINISDYTFRIFDVGGQRSERRKWIHCFDCVNGLIFVCSLSEYNQNLVEDENTNRMHESIRLFGSTCNSQWFKNSTIILFLNKKDLFIEKINKIPLSVCFPEFTGSNTEDEAAAYIRAKFEEVNRNKKKEIYTHFTCATDTEGVNFVFSAVSNTIIKENLKEYGLL